MNMTKFRDAMVARIEGELTSARSWTGMDASKMVSAHLDHARGLIAAWRCAESMAKFGTDGEVSGCALDTGKKGFPELACCILLFQECCTQCGVREG